MNLVRLIPVADWSTVGSRSYCQWIPTYYSGSTEGVTWSFPFKYLHILDLVFLDFSARLAGLL